MSSAGCCFSYNFKKLGREYKKTALSQVIIPSGLKKSVKKKVIIPSVKKGVLEKIRKFHRKTPVLESPFNNSLNSNYLYK